MKKPLKTFEQKIKLFFIITNKLVNIYTDGIYWVMQPLSKISAKVKDHHKT